MSNMRKTVAGAAGAVLLALGFVPAARGDNTGETVYKAKCVVCHAADGSGNTTMGKKMNLRDLGSPEVQKQTDAELTDIVAKGKNKMPGYEKTLKPEEIKALVAYMRTMKKK